jgi:hypothetical protein
MNRQVESRIIQTEVRYRSFPQAPEAPVVEAPERASTKGARRLLLAACVEHYQQTRCLQKQTADVGTWPQGTAR